MQPDAGLPHALKCATKDHEQVAFQADWVQASRHEQQHRIVRIRAEMVLVKHFPVDGQEADQDQVAGAAARCAAEQGCTRVPLSADCQPTADRCERREQMREIIE